ncbi:hypothetical protein [Salibacterium lacus]|uniref:Uncharacterized protein n=1 Tax=Salibacterium lacus TaxID=1898109 RepID=A0ABW5T0K1_9BACI
MMYGRKWNVIIIVLAVVGLFALVGDNVGMVVSILTAIFLFYTGARLLRRAGSGISVASGLVLFIIGALVLAGSISFWAGIVVLAAAMGMLWNQRRSSET